MAQTFPRFCPRCGATTLPGRAVCVNCGLNFAPRITQDNPQLNNVPMPTPPGSMPRKRGRIGVLLLFLLVVLLLGVIGYIVASLLGVHIGKSGITTQPAIITTPLQVTLSYAGVGITLLDAQQAQNFLDDPVTSSTDASHMVRLHLQADNKTANTIDLSYMKSAALLTTAKNAIAPAYVSANSVVAAGTTQTNTLDFVVPTDIKIDQLTLQLGTTNEAQMTVPLKQHVDVSLYDPTTTKATATTSYMGLDWMLTSTTKQWSIDGHQASKNMRYIVVTLSVNNTLSQTAITGSPYDYMRLLAGTVVASPRNTTLPVSFDAGANGQTGTVTFLIPQNATTLTLTFLSQAQSGFDQATMHFQV